MMLRTGRGAVGETMAVTMVMATQRARFQASLLSQEQLSPAPSPTSSGIQPHAYSESALIELGLVLLVVASLFNIAAPSAR